MGLICAKRSLDLTEGKKSLLSDVALKQASQGGDGVTVPRGVP